MVGNVGSSGRIGTVEFLIVPHSVEYNTTPTEYNVTVTTQKEILETKCSCWQAAKAWVERIAKQDERRNDEIDRDY